MSEWIQSRIALRLDHHVIRMADELKLPTRFIVGAFNDFWGWFSINTCDGRVTLDRDSYITLCANLDEHCGATGFCAAAEHVGWLVYENGELSIPNWDRYLSQGAKARALTARRTREYRARKQRDARPSHRRDATPSPEEKRREDINNPPKPPPTGGACRDSSLRCETEKPSHEENGQAIDHARSALAAAMAVNPDELPDTPRRQIDRAAKELARLNIPTDDIAAAWRVYCVMVATPQKPPTPQGMLKAWPNLLAHIPETKQRIERERAELEKRK